MAQKRLSKYKEEALKHGIKIIDIYRGKEDEVIRFLYKGKVYVVKIRGYRENMTPEEFVKVLLDNVRRG